MVPENRGIIEKIKREQSALTSSQDAYTVLIYGDPMVFNHFRLGAEIKRLEEAYGNPVLAYEAFDADEFKSILVKLSDNATPLQNLVLRGIHGFNYEGLPELEIVDYKNDDFALVGFSELQKEGVHLNFTKSAFIFLDSCNLVEAKNIETIKISFDEFRKIGFDSGWIYLNDSDGAYAFENTFFVPFWKSAGGFKQKLWHFTFQVLGWPVIAPLFYYKDRVEFNIGFLMGKSLSHEVILSTRSEKVINGKITGTLVYEQ